MRCTKPSKQYNLISATFAFILWGGWSYFINSKYGTSAGLISGFTQGAASFTITLFIVHAITFLTPKFHGKLSQFFLPAVITVCFTGSCLALIHIIIGTPAIAYTISPALLVAFSFCIFTTNRIQRNIKGK